MCIVSTIRYILLQPARYSALLASPAGACDVLTVLQAFSRWGHAPSPACMHMLERATQRHMLVPLPRLTAQQGSTHLARATHTEGSTRQFSAKPGAVYRSRRRETIPRVHVERGGYSAAQLVLLLEVNMVVSWCTHIHASIHACMHVS